MEVCTCLLVSNIWTSMSYIAPVNTCDSEWCSAYTSQILRLSSMSRIPHFFPNSTSPNSSPTWLRKLLSWRSPVKHYVHIVNHLKGYLQDVDALPTSIESSTATNSSFPAKVLPVAQPSRQFWDCGGWKSDSLWNFSIVVQCGLSMDCKLSTGKDNELQFVRKKYSVI